MPKSIALVLHKDKVLLGEGGKWLADSTPKGDKAALAKKQQSTAKTATEATTEILSRLPAGTIMKPVVNKGTYFSTRFIRKADPNPPGFLKGDIETGESAKDAIVREIEEETFTKLPASRFTEVHTGIFKIELTDAEAKDIVSNWKRQFDAGIGELVSLQWVDIKDIPRYHLNKESQSAVQHLPKSGGRRTRRRMLQKPKTLKKRIR